MGQVLAVIVLRQAMTAQKCEFLIDVNVENDLLMLLIKSIQRLLK